MQNCPENPYTPAAGSIYFNTPAAPPRPPSNIFDARPAVDNSVETVEIRIEAPADRRKLGTLRVLNSAGALVAGPFPCLLKSDNLAAAKAGNPARDPTRQDGDTPLGEYKAAWCPAGASSRSYGPYKRILLDPTAGDALAAKKNGRRGLMIHGGAPGYLGVLRPTDGCVRVADGTMLQLERFTKISRVTVTAAAAAIVS
jgi:hypothetical protein